ncbi:acyl-CoA N-acyltransferase [Aspergillus coremiiformis]|uniref:Acyl-CoA N-acyltransferase n=1 Tax=Aspergillus coremiiformis TaxID=138285 RepID=A0A5N6YTY4_9EURO|nr:acyl-CoA N-acyltransferase [Aspergillus coremiiformis]
MTIEIVPLTEETIPAATEIIQQAFTDDPYFNWVFDTTQGHHRPRDEVERPHPPSRGPDKPNRETQFNKQRNQDSLTARCRWGINNAIFHIARETDTGSVLGVSCWLAPEPPSWYSWFQGWVLAGRQVVNNVWHGGRGGLRARRYWIWKERQRAAQRAIWDAGRGYYFCNIVAVRPEVQGRGVGRRLFGAVIDVADREGVGCYLESSRLVPNVRIYEKMGFRVVREMECRDGGDVCMLYCMVREPIEK